MSEIDTVQVEIQRLIKEMREVKQALSDTNLLLATRINEVNDFVKQDVYDYRSKAEKMYFDSTAMMTKTMEISGIKQVKL